MTGHRVFTIIRDVLIMATCLVILYAAFQAYAAVGRLQDGLNEMGGDTVDTTEMNECNANADTIWDGDACIPIEEYLGE